MKKIWLHGLFVSILILASVGCSNTKKSTQELSSDNTSIDSSIPHLEINYNKNSLMLTNLFNGETVAELKLDENCFIHDGEMFKLDSGYGVITNHGDTPVTVEEVEGIEMINFPEDASEKRFLFLDDKLQIKKELPFTNIIPEKDYENISETVISYDGNLIVCNLGEELYYYNCESKKSGYLLKESQNGIEFERIKFTKDRRIAFFGFREEDPEESTCYGVLDPETSELIVFAEENYKASNLTISDDFVCFTDSVDPYRDYQSSGKVLLIDLNTNANKVIPVDGEESTMSIVTMDGKYLLSAKQDENYQIRQYNIQTEEIVMEHTINQKGEMKILDICPVENSILYAAIFQSEDEEKIIDTFQYKE